jgi:UDP-glucuronate 4-epimerase
MKILVTGAAGFIGSHLVKRFCAGGHDVIGIDDLNDYYDVSLKEARLAELEPLATFAFIKMDISERVEMEGLFEKHEFDRVIHMAAQAGVRYSLENPHAYIQANIVGFMNVLECCRYAKVSHLVYASSSSVYGSNTKLPFSVSDNVDHPISLYAATKKGGELMAHTYSHLYGLPTTGLRFFTVYGPWGRPDMALFKFTKAMLNGEPLNVYNEGKMKRDFTYIDDIVEGVVRVTDFIPTASDCHPERANGESKDLPGSVAPYRLYNIGNNSPVELMDFVRAVEKELGCEARINYLPMQPGDVPETYADVDDLMQDVGFKPSTTVQAGIHRFVEWYKSYYCK